MSAGRACRPQSSCRKSVSISATCAVMHSAAHIYESAIVRPSGRLSNATPLLEPSTASPTGHAKRASHLYVEGGAHNNA